MKKTMEEKASEAVASFLAKNHSVANGFDLKKKTVANVNYAADVYVQGVHYGEVTINLKGEATVKNVSKH